MPERPRPRPERPPQRRGRNVARLLADKFLRVNLGAEGYAVYRAILAGKPLDNEKSHLGPMPRIVSEEIASKRAARSSSGTDEEIAEEILKELGE